MPPDIARDTYLHSGQDLFRVEFVNGGRVLLEDCRTTQLLDVPMAFLAQLSLVERRAGRTG